MLVCDQCGSRFGRPAGKGRKPLRCSAECKRNAVKDLLSNYPRKAGSARMDPTYVRRVRECGVCGVKWSNLGLGRGPLKFCSDGCRDAAAKGNRNPKARIPCSQGCGVTLPGSAFQFSGFRRWCGECARRRPHALPVQLRRWVYARDGGVCQICGVLTDPEDKASDGTIGSLYPTVDHITPRSLGGTDEKHNLRTAHHRCNSVRGVARDEQLQWAI